MFAGALVCVAGFAATASAELTITATAEPIGGYQPRATSVNVYAGVAGNPGYAGFTAGLGSLGFDDYSAATNASPTMTLAKLQFVGGVGATGGPGGSINIAFFDSAQTPFSNVNINLPQGGRFIWTITLGTVALDGKDSTFQVPVNGFMQITNNSTQTGQWFLTTAAPTIGTNDIAIGGAVGTHRHAFGLYEIPAPGAAALLGLGGLFAARRRRN
jgi:hypothetical protein